MKHVPFVVAASIPVVFFAGCSVNPLLLPANSRQSETFRDESELDLPTTPKAQLAKARELAWEAAVIVQNPPHPVETWQKARVKWRQAIRVLEAIATETSVATQAQQRLTVYRTNYAAIDDRLETEQAAVSQLESAQALAWQAAVTVQKPPHTLAVWQSADRKWQQAIAQLEAIPAVSSVSSQSQEKLAIYRRNQKVIQQQIATQKKTLTALATFKTTANYLKDLPTQVAAGQAVGQVGIEYQDYVDRLQLLKTTLAELQPPQGSQHPIYTDLAEALRDYELGITIWQAYQKFKRDNVEWLRGSDSYDQLFPISLVDGNTLMEKYQVTTYLDGSKISLKFTLWAIWDRAKQVVDRAEQEIKS
ncbi:hypothetical protein [Pantanalinema sp. GBBB05]|uniref:hypothetical protein n=1 Tax=Pantanalinema sp. GBBB05 TaxID=2604139 RepID=UPI001D80C92A|nr:hypothetical protein [Pantanalinema sp. GBBB05]